MQHVFQALLATVPKFDAKIGDLNAARDFNLFTESYGGHYGPAFFNYFYNQNLKIDMAVFLQGCNGMRCRRLIKLVQLRSGVRISLRLVD